MKNWTEFHISLIYFSGLIISLIISVFSLLYLRPIKKSIERIFNKHHFLWGNSFKSTILIAGLLGGLSVSFRDCSGNYDQLLKSRYMTALKGFEQISSAFDYLTFILGIWLLIFAVFWIVFNRKKITAIKVKTQ